ncbi:nitrite transporter [Erwinia sp. S38]|uniref:nitrite transporter n=1 Tax=Erwinia sp. S38 TaxID=2769338 RepID=UPI00190C144C|nr:nitrite transporter [Erwinia sp. S38]MBK0003179.1 nitrite transporter [Erwinia sp. S38]
MFDPDKYRSVTWLKGGRVFPQLDCFGVVLEVRKDLKMNEWPEFTGITRDDGGLDKEAKRFNLSLLQCDPLPGAVAECYTGSSVTHLGVVVSIDNQLFVVDCNPRSNVTFCPIERFKRRYVKVEFWQ